MTDGYLVNLHAHETSGSIDSITNAGQMARQYAAMGYSAGVLLGHNIQVDAGITRGDFTTLSGIEHGAGDGTVEPHVVELPDHDFAFLAHPGATFPDNTKERAREVIENWNLDGVEKFNGGVMQYEGSIGDGIVELGNDDAHTTAGCGASFNVVFAEDGSPDALMDAVKRGDVTAMNHRRSGTEAVGKVMAALITSLSQHPRRYYSKLAP